MLLRLLYLSEATVHVDEEMMRSLVGRYAVKNRETGIGGVLGFKDGYFFQVLEGDQTPVLELFRAIEADPMHRNVQLLHTAPTSHRIFRDNPMAALTAGMMDAIDLDLLHVAHGAGWDESGSADMIQAFLHNLRREVGKTLT